MTSRDARAGMFSQNSRVRKLEPSYIWKGPFSEMACCTNAWSRKEPLTEHKILSFLAQRILRKGFLPEKKLSINLTIIHRVTSLLQTILVSCSVVHIYNYIDVNTFVHVPQQLILASRTWFPPWSSEKFAGSSFWKCKPDQKNSGTKSIKSAISFWFFLQNIYFSLSSLQSHLLPYLPQLWG